MRKKLHKCCNSLLVLVVLALLCIALGGCAEEQKIVEISATDIFVLTDGSYDTIDVDLSLYSNIPKSVFKAYEIDDFGGYVIATSSRGYKNGLILLTYVDDNGFIVDTTCISSEEEHYIEHNYGEKFIGLTYNDIDSVDTVSGSTMTASAYREAMKDVILTYRSITGSSGR